MRYDLLSVTANARICVCSSRPYKALLMPCLTGNSSSCALSFLVLTKATGKENAVAPVQRGTRRILAYKSY